MRDGKVSIVYGFLILALVSGYMAWQRIGLRDDNDGFELALFGTIWGFSAILFLIAYLIYYFSSV